MKYRKGHIYSNEEILDGIRHGDPALFRYVSGYALPFLLKFMGKAGNRRQAEEIIQDAFVIIFRKISSSGLIINCKFLTFFIAVCKKIWNYQDGLTANEESFREEPVKCADWDDREIEVLWMESREFRIYRYHFNRLKEKQQRILEASLDGLPYRDLYLEFGYGSVEAFKNEVYRIRKDLFKKICADPEFKPLQNKSKWSFDD